MLNQTQAASAFDGRPLYSLAELRRRKIERLGNPPETIALRRRQRPAPKPRSPKLTTEAAFPVTRPQHSIDLDTIKQVDAIQSAAERLANVSPLDALPIARSALAVTLRLSWVRATGRPDVAPKFQDVPHKLYQAGLINKAALDRLRRIVQDDAGNVKTATVLACTRSLIVWLASDPITSQA